MKIITLPRRSRFQYATGDFTTAIPIRPWTPGDNTFGGVRRSTATGIPAVDHVRRDDLFFVTLRLWEDEHPDARAFIRWAMQGEPFTWTPDIEFPDDTILCYLQRPAAGERWSYRRMADFPRVVELDLVLRQTDMGSTSWAGYFTPPASDLPIPLPPDPTEPVEGDVYYATRFANGDKSDVMNGVSLMAGNAQVVEYPNPGGGSFCLRHRHTVGNGNQEQRADHPSLRIPGLFWGMYARLPANYFHRDGPSSDNNKWWRSWGGRRSDGKQGYQFYDVKGGFSTDRTDPVTGDSRMRFEYGWSNLFGEQAGVGPRGIPFTDVIFPKYADRWFKVQGQIWLSSEPGENDGILRLWVDGDLIQEATNLDFYSRRPDGIHYLDAFYWEGAANSGWDYTQDILTAQIRTASTLLASDPDNATGWAA